MMSRNIPKKIQDIILKKFGGHCAFSNCKWPSVALHHVKRFAIVKRHLPEEIVPLCKIHHELAHAELIENEESWTMMPALEIGRGRTTLSPVTNNKNAKLLVDKKFQKCRRWAMRIRRSAC